MKFSLKRLQYYIEDPLPTSNVLRDAIIFHAFEVESVEEVGDDTVFDIKVLPDRAHDCFSHQGMAHEIARICDLEYKTLEFSLVEPTTTDGVLVSSDAVRRYMAIRMSAVDQKGTPMWMREYLASLGQRSISILVDIANVAMFDAGQPVHIFDAKKVIGDIVVRQAYEGEKITTLTGEEKVLSGEITVIADQEKVLAIAGIKGGVAAEVDEETTDIIIEVANFEPTAVRKASKILKLQTDASKRFENDISLIKGDQAVHMVCELVMSETKAVLDSVFDSKKITEPFRTISFERKDIVRILGEWITDELLRNTLIKLDWEYTELAGLYTLSVPQERIDCTGIHDIAEEIGRLAGYHNAGVRSTLPFTLFLAHDDSFKNAQAVRTHFIKEGYSEVMNYSFVKKGEVEISYGPKDKSALRTNLSEGLLVSYKKNILNAPLLGSDTVAIFEIGTVFLNDKEEFRVGWADKSGVYEISLEEYVQKNIPDEKDTTLTVAIHQKRFVDWSPYPHIVRDVAVWVLEAGKEEELDTIVTMFGEEYCKIPVRMFDRFEKDGKLSVAYRFVFQSDEKTLTDEEVDSFMHNLLEDIKEKSYFELR